MITQDTIAAISTPLGEGGIGIVRLSGRDAIAIASGMFVSSTGRGLEQGRVFHGHVMDGAGRTIDEVLLHVMRGPKSYTCEDVIEINAHGGSGPLAAILEQALARGARLARPGEFTLRAFLNGRIDLVQAEAVIDQIRAKSDAGLRAAAAAANGAVSVAINEIKQTLVDALARIEAAVDFPDEDMPDLVTQALRGEIEQALSRVNEMLSTAEAGRLYREGASIAIAGEPNVGKSSLFNALLRDARAIVSAIPGTTRDRIEETISLNGVPVRLTDTAGLRTTEDEIERIGVDIAREAVRTADIVLYVLDAQSADTAMPDALTGVERPVWVVLNKMDLAPNAPAPTWAAGLAGISCVSAHTSEGLHELEAALGSFLLGSADVVPEKGLINRAHQRESLRRAQGALEQVIANFDASPELLSVDVREALSALGEITGETTPDDVLEVIFSSFCVGK